MARSGITVMGASCLLALAATLGGAKAQTAGAPLPLLQIDHAKTAAHHPAPARIAKTKPAGKAEHRRIAKHIDKGVHAKTRVAGAAHDLPAPAATHPQKPPQSASQTIWPSTTAALGYAATPKAAGAQAGLAPSAARASVTTEQVVDTDPNGILNGQHAVPAAVPTPVKPAASAPRPQVAATKPTTPIKVAGVAPKSPVHAMLFRPTVPSPVGSASWIAQLLAALGGAIAAGAVAWLLIRPAPARSYD